MAKRQQKKQRDRLSDQYMTVDEGLRFMHDWAAEQNEIEKHNRRVQTGMDLEHAERVGIDWREPGGLEKARRQRAKDADIGARQREHGRNSPGRRGRHKIPRDAAEAAVQQIHEKYPEYSHSAVCTMVGTYTNVTKERKTILKGLGITKAHYEDGQMVCRLTSKLKWPDPRSKTTKPRKRLPKDS